ncbi:hypothetical protein LEMLEM_LOCUS25565, partial [Lemmus lemmus]
MPPRTKRQAPQKPPLSPTLQPRNNTPRPPRSLSPPLPSCVPARPPHQVEETKRDAIRPEPPEDGILPQPTTENEIKTTSGEPTGPRHIPPPKPPRTKKQAPQKPPLSPTLQSRNNTPGPPRSLSPPLPSCVPARPPHQDEETKRDIICPEPPEDGILPQSTTENEIKTTSGEPTGPRRIPPTKPPRTKRQAPQKPPLSSTLQPRNNTPGPPSSLSPPLPSCVPARPPHQVLQVSFFILPYVPSTVQENQQDHDVFLHQSHLGPRDRHLKSLLCFQLCNLRTILQDHYGPQVHLFLHACPHIYIDFHSVCTNFMLHMLGGMIP